MDLRQQVVDTGLLLLEKKLVARTWGNVSAKVDDEHFLITPKERNVIMGIRTATTTTPTNIIVRFIVYPYKISIKRLICIISW